MVRITIKAKGKNRPEQDAVMPKGWRAQLKISLGVAGLASISIMLPTPSQAMQWQAGQVTVTLQSTVGWTGGYRVSPIDNSYLSKNINGDDGDRNFRHGVMANRFQDLEELNIRDGDYGLRGSFLAWIDTVYLHNNENNSPYTVNTYSTGPRGFPSATVANEGRRIEPLALFLYGAEYFDSGRERLSWQLGRQTITWGQTLFTFDGIAGLQAPIDYYQAATLPNPQAQALYLPTGAAQAAFMFANGISVDGYWKFEYMPSILPGVGSYFSASDITGPGASQYIQGYHGDPYPNAPRLADRRPPNGLDQFGISLHDTIGNYTYGAYFVRAIPTTPGVVFQAQNIIKDYAQYYPDPVNAYGVSFSTTVGQANVAGELSGRTNQPLSSSIVLGGPLPGYGKVPYAKGDIVNASISTTFLTNPLPLFPNGIAISAETTFNDVVSVTANRDNIVPGTTNDGGSTEMVLDPNWYPMPNLELDTPIGWSESYIGDSKFDGGEQAGTGTFNASMRFTYKANLQFGVNYQLYYGSINREPLVDRDFITVYINKTF